MLVPTSVSAISLIRCHSDFDSPARRKSLLILCGRSRSSVLSGWSAGSAGGDPAGLRHRADRAGATRLVLRLATPAASAVWYGHPPVRLGFSATPTFGGAPTRCRARPAGTDRPRAPCARGP